MSGQKIKKVAVLMGGISSERKISLLSGQGVVCALQELGYQVKSLDVSADLALLVRQLKQFKPDVVFNALHGKWGEDGTIQAVLNWLKIPYTHSGVMASGIGMNKEMTRKLAQQLGISVAPGGLKDKEAFCKMKLPLVVKPNDEGSSCGVYIIQTEKERQKVLKSWSKNKKLLVEKYIAGRELSVAVLDGHALGTVELKVKKGWYDYHNKYAKNAVKHSIPAPVSLKITKQLKKYAEQIHTVLGCCGITRSDFRLSESGKLYFLEINTNPGMTPVSLVPDIAQSVHITYNQLVDKLIQGAKWE